MASILSFKNFLISKINTYLYEPEASFLAGLLVGAKNAIPPDLLLNFNRTGTTHIIAISGWNITFLGSMFLPVLFSFGLNRKKSFYIMLAVIFLFCLLVGFGPAVVRAGIMGVIALYAKAYGRYNHAGRALLYSLVMMFLINPYIIYDVGFYLSVIATFGLIYFSPIIEDRIKIKKGLLKESLPTTISAVIYTLPVSMFVFGSVSLWALPVNIIILPFIAYAIIFGIAALPAAVIINNILVAKILFLPSAAILSFIEQVVSLFGNLSFGYLSLKINFWIMLALYAGILYFTFYKLRKANERF